MSETAKLFGVVSVVQIASGAAEDFCMAPALRHRLVCMAGDLASHSGGPSQPATSSLLLYKIAAGAAAALPVILAVKTSAPRMCVAL